MPLKTKAAKTMVHDGYGGSVYVVLHFQGANIPDVPGRNQSVTICSPTVQSLLKNPLACIPSNPSFR